MDRNLNEDDDSAPAETAAGSKLKVVAHYAMLGFAPLMSVAALVVAVVAVGSARSAPPVPAIDAAQIESLNASLTASRNEVESLKFSLARERSQRAEERKRTDEREEKIVRAVSGLQTKMKISPTLEEQLREADVAPAAAPAAAPHTPAAVEKPAASVAAATHTPAAAQPVAPAKPAAPAPKSAEQTPAQVKVLKEAIEKFNKK